MTAADPLLELLASRAYRRGQFTLASGRSSEHYVNCKPVTLSGRGAQLLAPNCWPWSSPMRWPSRASPSALIRWSAGWPMPQPWVAASWMP